MTTGLSVLAAVLGIDPAGCVTRLSPHQPPVIQPDTCHVAVHPHVFEATFRQGQAPEQVCLLVNAAGRLDPGQQQARVATCVNSLTGAGACGRVGGGHVRAVCACKHVMA